MPWNKIERLRDDHRDDMLGQNRSRGYWQHRFSFFFPASSTFLIET
jgi:hypothetical protein